MMRLKTTCFPEEGTDWLKRDSCPGPGGRWQKIGFAEEDGVKVPTAVEAEGIGAGVSVGGGVTASFSAPPAVPEYMGCGPWPILSDGSPALRPCTRL